MIASLNNNDHHFLFDADIAAPLSITKKELRSESEYDRDIYAEKTALKYIERISQCLDGNIYLITASQDAASPNKLRSKKGVLWDERELRKLDSRNGEVEVGYGNTRLVSLVNLDGFNYDTSEAFVLNWIFSLIILTDVDIDVLNSFVEGWIVKGHEPVLAFNYDAVSKDLLKLATTAVLRYFPADNGRNEAFVLVGNREYVDDCVEKCINI